uniref:Uncharacterized protein n=1 Tax=viral metagenome TaxID=1070528 RepID=A0A6H1ZBJ3_9ZZZZ
MTKKEFYANLVVEYMDKGELVLMIWTVREGEPVEKAKYLYGKIKVKCGPGTSGSLLSSFELEIRKTKENMYDCLLKEYGGKVDDVILREEVER